MVDPLEGGKYVQIEASDLLGQPGLSPTREQFLTDPTRLMFGSGLQPEWVVEAYRASDRFRQEVLHALTRSVSKYGDFHLARGWMEMLATGFSPDQIRSLYCAIRDNSGRGEDEWRVEFEQAFPVAVGHLPAPLLPVRETGVIVRWQILQDGRVIEEFPYRNRAEAEQRRRTLADTTGGRYVVRIQRRPAGAEDAEPGAAADPARHIGSGTS